MPSASANAMPMKSVAVWAGRGRRVAQRAGEEVAGHVADTERRETGAQTGNACADETDPFVRYRLP